MNRIFAFNDFFDNFTQGILTKLNKKYCPHYI